MSGRRRGPAIPPPANLSLPTDPMRHAAAARRAARIARFAAVQRRQRDWISFEEIADWCAREGHSVFGDESKRRAALDLLSSDLLAGMFDLGGRSRVLYLHPEGRWLRMTADRLRQIKEWNADLDEGRSQYLPQCWIRRGMLDNFLARHRLEADPARFRRSPDTSFEVLTKPKRGRPSDYNWPAVKLRLQQYVEDNGAFETQLEVLQKARDFATEMHPERREPAESTVRAAISRHGLSMLRPGGRKSGR